MRHATIATLLVSSCSWFEGGNAERDCSQLVRVASQSISVMSIKPGGVAQAVPARCTAVHCLHTRADVVAVAQPDKTVWAAWPGFAGVVADDLVSPEATWARRQTVADAPRKAPELPPEFRYCGTTAAGGGWGFHVIRNDGSIWQHVQWEKPPTAPDVVALSADAYPIADDEGALCAFATQRAPREWDIHAAGKIVAASSNQEHPPARCASDGAVDVRLVDERNVRILKDGTELPRTHDPVKMAPRLSLNGTVLIAAPRERLELSRRGGGWALPIDDDGRDLAGKMVTPGAVRERIVSTGDGVDTLLIAERLRRPDCSTHEALHLVRISDHSVTTVAEGPLMFLRVSASQGTFYWLQVKPRTVDLSTDEIDTLAL